MTGSQKKSGGDSDHSSATDGDMDIAYSLQLAEQQWGNEMGINYKSEATALISDIRQWNVDTVKWTLLLSNFTEPKSSKNEYYATRSSDFMPANIRAYDRQFPSQGWQKVIDGEYQVFSKIQDPHTGLLPDFIVNIDTTPSPAPPKCLRDEGLDCGTYNYNGCRIPWRLGLDYLQTGNPQAKTILTKLNNWMQQSTDTIPRKVGGGYSLGGTNLAPQDTLHMCYVSPLAVSAMISKKNQKWLNRLWDYMTAIKMKDYKTIDDLGYYDNTIKLINMIIISGNYWKP